MSALSGCQWPASTLPPLYTLLIQIPPRVPGTLSSPSSVSGSGPQASLADPTPTRLIANDVRRLVRRGSWSLRGGKGPDSGPLVALLRSNSAGTHGRLPTPAASQVVWGTLRVDAPVTVSVWTKVDLRSDLTSMQWYSCLKPVTEKERKEEKEEKEWARHCCLGTRPAAPCPAPPHPDPHWPGLVGMLSLPTICWIYNLVGC
eukprot:1192353-Prorocentrum_minimum.AAC.4